MPLYAAPEAKQINHDKLISVMSYNVLFNSHKNKESITLIQKQNPDIICLTELTTKFLRQFNKRVTKYPYQANFPKSGTWGVGILSRFPIVTQSVFPIRPHRIPGATAIIKINSRRVLIACIHLFPPAVRHKKYDSLVTTLLKNQALRVKQANFLSKKFSKRKGAIVLMGDMNEGRSDPAIKVLLGNGYTHACEQAKISTCGATYPGATSILPAILEIDHILGRGLKFYKASTITGGGSDHYPVTAQFRMLNK